MCGPRSVRGRARLLGSMPSSSAPSAANAATADRSVQSGIRRGEHRVHGRRVVIRQVVIGQAGRDRVRCSPASAPRTRSSGRARRLERPSRRPRRRRGEPSRRRACRRAPPRLRRDRADGTPAPPGRRSSTLHQSRRSLVTHQLAACREPLTDKTRSGHDNHRRVSRAQQNRVDGHRGRRVLDAEFDAVRPHAGSSCSLLFLPTGSAPLLLLAPDPSETHRHRLRAAYACGSPVRDASPVAEPSRRRHARRPARLRTRHTGTPSGPRVGSSMQPPGLNIYTEPARRVHCSCHISVVVVSGGADRKGSRRRRVIGWNPARTVRMPWWTPPGIYLGWIPPSRQMTWLVR